MEKPKVILESKRLILTLERLCNQVFEEHPSLEDVCFIGIQERGVLLANRLIPILKNLYGKQKVLFGKLDISFYRDDFRTRTDPIKVSSTDIEFNLEGRKIILIDDVLYTGRTVHAAISAILDFGRPSSIEFLTLVDRRFNRHFPIKADYKGIVVDAVDEAYVKVNWIHLDGEDKVLLYSAKKGK
jgi:pyrimidine operon attenuation protein/uracil phosphoribosyltransferase